MKIGYNNILTTLWFILMLSCGSFVALTTFDKIFNSDIILIARFFVVLSYILTLGVMIFLLLRFRLLFVTKDKLISLYLFKLQKTTILLDEIKTSKWSTWDIKSHKFISLTITDKSKNKISISDFEFENFDNLVASFIGENYLDKSIIHYKEQAKQNISFTNFITLLTAIFLISMIVKVAFDKNINNTIVIIFMLTFVTLFTTLKRSNKYRQIEKYGL